MGGEGSHNPDRTASGPDLWPVQPQEKRKGRADGGQGEGKRKEGGDWARGLGFQIWKQMCLREFITTIILCYFLPCKRESPNCL